VQFLFVYIREAHPRDEWQLDINPEDDVVIDQPTTFTERQEVAQTCAVNLALTMPCVVDDMENTVDEAYCGWPERLFVVDVEGRIAYAGMQGPFGFEPDEVGKWLRKNVGEPQTDVATSD
jgi:hypothetical protein